MNWARLRIIATLYFQLIFAIQLTAAEAEKTSVIALKVKLQELSDRMLYPARIAAYRSVAVPAEIDGFIQKLDVMLGQKVRSGQALLSISNPDPVYDFKSFSIKSPFAGVVSSIDIAVGDRVTRGKTLLNLADSSSLKILVHLTTEDVKKLKPGYVGKLHIGKQDYPVRIRAMSSIIDAATGTAPCELELVDAGKNAGLLIAGSIGQVSFSINQRKAIVLPERAIVYRGKDPHVIRLNPESKAQYELVSIIKQSSGVVEIDSKLQDGDTIVASSQGFVVDGSTVNIESTKVN